MKGSMRTVYGRIFLVATLLLPLRSGDRLDAVQAKRGGVGIVEAATSTLTTKKIKDVQPGEVIQSGSSKFVKIAANRYQAVKPYTCADPVLTHSGAVKNFDYTGGEQTFTAYAGCQYTLEVWGGQGGSANNVAGGYGGYAAGVFGTHQNINLYVYIGGSGGINKSLSGDMAGGFNGGGYTYHWINNDLIAGAGGGATHIALISGNLNALSSYRSTGGNNISKEILIVAGGGGGSSLNRGVATIGGHGGGMNGVDGAQNTQFHDGYYGKGGSQSGGGISAQSATYRGYKKANDGSFGRGGDSATTSGSGGGPAGGAGWYGGGGATTADTGGGGSGYIGSSNLISAAGVTKHMTCYNCTTSSADATRTQSNTCVNETPTADCSKTGNGYARITRLN